MFSFILNVVLVVIVLMQMKAHSDYKKILLYKAKRREVEFLWGTPVVIMKEKDYMDLRFPKTDKDR